MDDQQALASATRRILDPLVEILLRHGVPHAALAEWAKQVYVEVAERQGGAEGRKVSTSHLSVVTGLTRKDVARIRNAPSDPANAEDAARYHRAARVVTGWNRSEPYAEGGRPLDLALDGDAPSFASLVKEFAGDVPTRAVLDELERVNAVESTDDGRLRLRVRAWIPKEGEAQKLEVLGIDTSGLIRTIAHNLDHDGEDALFQRQVYYDNLPQEALTDLRALTGRHGQELLETLDRYMAAHDRDSNPDAEGTGHRAVGIGVFYFEEPADTDEDEQ